ncbi:peroxiredoxin-like family protein [Streptomyces sp. NRRL F-5126]|uniref:peroxiredoxin-like family protein n=1 Tax=Streptomyces sp. NRRL F-5126 TaxID=1463857 RepID=UPI0004C9ECE0|nr:peroxiredoxin-like family protein [Streptomyces sp. NRRL F-5126]
MTTTPTPIADQVAGIATGQAQQLSAEVLQVFASEQSALDAAGAPAGIAEAGAPMPDAELLDVDGNATTLERTRSGRGAVVVFYRGVWCPFCNAALHAYQRELAAVLEDRGLALIAVSPQKPDGSLTMKEAHELSFAVLSDPGNQIGRRLGIVTRPTDDVRQAQASLGLDLTAVNADGTHDIVMPTVAIVDAEGIVRWIDVHPNYTTRTEPAEILAALTTLD